MTHYGGHSASFVFLWINIKLHEKIEHDWYKMYTAVKSLFLWLMDRKTDIQTDWQTDKLTDHEMIVCLWKRAINLKFLFQSNDYFYVHHDKFFKLAEYQLQRTETDLSTLEVSGNYDGGGGGVKEVGKSCCQLRMGLEGRAGKGRGNNSRNVVTLILTFCQLLTVCSNILPC